MSISSIHVCFNLAHTWFDIACDDDNETYNNAELKKKCMGLISVHVIYYNGPSTISSQDLHKCVYIISTMIPH